MPLPPDSSRARAAKNAPGFAHALGGLADIISAGFRGATKSSLGWPGDLERLLGEQLPEVASAWRSGAPLKWNLDTALKVLENTKNAPTLFPTMSDWGRWLPKSSELVMPSAKNPFESILEFTGATPRQVGALALAAGRATAPLARRAASLGAEALHRGVAEGRGPLGALGALKATVEPSYAVRPRGGNFDETGLKRGLQELEEWVPDPQQPAGFGAAVPEAAVNHNDPAVAINKWLNTQLRNYIRKDMGSPADPLLQLEKELPNLHLTPEQMATFDGGLQDTLYRAGWGRQGRPGPTWQNSWNYVKEHNRLMGTPEGSIYSSGNNGALTSPTPISPWGYATDHAIDGMNPGEYAENLLDWNNKGHRSDYMTKLRDRARNSDPPYPEGISDPEKEHLLSLYADEFIKGGDFLFAHDNPFNETLKKAFGDVRREMVPEWVDKLPNDTKVWHMPPSDAVLSMEDLGFNHVKDYLRAATEPHVRMRDAASPSEGERGVQNMLAELRNLGGAAMLPHPPQDLDRWKSLMDAGLDLDPASLGRLSVQDAVRKTAQWNQWMAERAANAPANANLSRGIARVHKEYPEEGMRWVELGKPEMKELPEGWSLQKGPWAHAGGEWALGSPESANGYKYFRSEEQAIQHAQQIAAEQELSAGLNAEGEAMGHCVGGYCDEVAENGTKIYSLRDAKNNPHVTVEARPRHTLDSAYEEGVAGRDRHGVYADILDQLHRDLRWRQPGRAGYATAAEEFEDKSSELASHSALMKWLSDKHPDLHEKYNTPGGTADIVQIKGKQNAAPVEKYLPFVQDFVRSGQWGDVGDLRNTGLIKYSGGKTIYRPGKAQNGLHGLTGVEAVSLDMPSGYMTPAEAADFLIKQGAPEDWARNHVGDFNKRYAEGGAVEDHPKFLQRLAGGGKVASLLERMRALAPEAGKAGAATSKAARASMARAGESFEDVVKSNPAAVRARGGNFDEYSLGSYLGGEHLAVPNSKYAPPWGTAADVMGTGDIYRHPAVRSWADTQLANYLKRDIGSPADPLLQLEKELPGLHLPPGALGGPAMMRAANNGRVVAGKAVLHSPERARAYLQKHKQLTSEPITPWGLHSDNELLGLTPEQYLRGPVSEAMDLMTPPEGLPDRLPGSMGSTFEDLKAYAAHPDNAELKKHLWLEKAPPDTKIWAIDDPNFGDNLGFGHVLDYLDTATEPATAAKRWLENSALAGNDQGMTLNDVLNSFRTEGRGSMLPFGTQELEKWKELMDAGLDLDPAALGRMSVQDAVRKTSQWNQFMAENMRAQMPGLRQGIKSVHKEYPDGMRWVELGEPDLPALTELPEGYRVDRHPKLNDASEQPLYGIRGPDAAAPFEMLRSNPEDSVKEWLPMHRAHLARKELEAGLNAEGKAMGHCVGGYCDEVSRRGTRIYSLRDAKGAPHVTVEVRPGRGSIFDGIDPEADDYFDKITSVLDKNLKKPELKKVMNAWGEEIGGLEDIMPWLEENLPAAWERLNPLATGVPPSIVQIKGKQNAAPVVQYQPYVQDFVRNGKWERVGDLHNTGLRSLDQEFSPFELQGMRRRGLAPESSYLTDAEMKALRLKYDQSVGTVDPPEYAHGGAVQPTAAAGSPARVKSRFEAALEAGRSK